ncbi:hypothetical protein Q5692_21430 [Microcoleus sp. C2C3]|uniref:hypothetical protein n=1 Tax=unclassified Microcoleus TaxID=2642155 RepID=UPI002FD29C33
MVTTLEDIKRLPVGERLPDLKALQNLIIPNDRKLIDACLDDNLSVRGEEKFKVLVSGSGIRVDCASQYISI